MKEKYQLIYEKEENPNYVYFILSGHVGLFRNKSYFIKKYKQGSYFGDIEIFKKHDRAFSAMTISNTKLLVIDKTDFLELLEKFP